MDGIIIINKEQGYTSNDVVQKVKKIYNKKVGHTGTLDPMATGVLPVLIGKGTLCSKYLMNHDKEYRAIIQLGKKTATGDIEGNIIETDSVNNNYLEVDKVQIVLKSFIGKQEQIPPMYSAIKINGKKLYEYARKNIEIEVKPRNIEIYKIELINVNKKEKQIEFKVSCSKGTYIRTLCEDISKKLGTVGCMSFLERTQVGDFNIENSITLRQLENIKEQENEDKELNKCIYTIEELFKNSESIALSDNQLQKFLNGVKLKINNSDGVYKIYLKQAFIGIGIVTDNLLKRDIVISE